MFSGFFADHAAEYILDDIHDERLKHALVLAMSPDPAENAASFGRWWLDTVATQFVLSDSAAEFLNTEAGLHADPAICFAHVLPNDMPLLMAALEKGRTSGGVIDCEFRVIDELVGMRWLRMVSLPKNVPGDGICNGLLIDISASRQASIREKLSFESAQFLVGSHKLEDAVTKVIQLVCKTLGWDWGAYWEVEQGNPQEKRLVCKYFWHNPGPSLLSFTKVSTGLRIAPGEGLVGRVWESGQPGWAENTLHDSTCLRRLGIKESNLQSGYAFPVAYQMADGTRHSPGVMEFFSNFARQREAQLPNISLAIGTLVAETVQRLEQMETINRMARIDEMTGVANRSHFHHLLNMACSRATASGIPFGVLYIDIDSFKPINDIFGHEAGNSVLIEFARRLLNVARSDCQIGRLGGDEFAILSHTQDPMTELRILAESILAEANRPFYFNGNELMISASIGISIYPKDGASTRELLISADSAMYRSKNSGRNRVSFFSHAIPFPDSSFHGFPTMEKAMRHALLENQFFLEYQPIFDSSGEKAIAIEALIRWRTIDGETVRPDAFIPIAEKSSLISLIDRWVIRRACADLALLHRSGFPDLQINVNMSASEFISTGLPDELMGIIEAFGVASRHVCLELTENMVMQHADKVIPVMETLRKRGFHISLDDFGTGHSSLSRLKQLPISSLKIDRSFITGLPGDVGSRAIVRTIFDLGRHMDLQIIVEGIETDAQFGFLRQFGYPWMQGFLLGRPTSVEKFITQHGTLPNNPVVSGHSHPPHKHKI